MNIRPTQATALSLIQAGLFSNLSKLVHAQEQLTSGKRILRVSDDPAGATLALAYSRRLGESVRHAAALESGQILLDSTATRLEEAGELLVDTRALLLQGLSGTLSDDDRRTLAHSVKELRKRLIELGNDRIDGRYLFGGTSTGTPPFVAGLVNGIERIGYAGNATPQAVQIGVSSLFQTTAPGSDVFALDERSGTSYTGLTGIRAGTSADQGSGFTHLVARHDATVATLGSGLALVNGGAGDTLLGDHALVVDAVAGTVQLDNGTALSIPAAGAVNLADFVVTDENGAELHLDFSGFTGAGFTGTVTGAGSLSLDGTSFTSVNFSETDLELVDAAAGVVLHVDTRGVRRAGKELVVFGGTVNAFDALQGIVDDLENHDGLPFDDLRERLSAWLVELDRNHENVLASLSEVGARSMYAERVQGALAAQGDQLVVLRSDIEDADLSQVALDLTRAQTTLELVQASSVQILSTSLINFLR